MYALRSRVRKYIYVGLTNNLERRVKKHNDGKERTTRSYIPYELIYSKEFLTRESAREEEKRLKSGYGKEFLRDYYSKNGTLQAPMAE